LHLLNLVPLLLK